MYLHQRNWLNVAGNCSINRYIKNMNHPKEIHAMVEKIYAKEADDQLPMIPCGFSEAHILYHFIGNHIMNPEFPEKHKSELIKIMVTVSRTAFVAEMN